MKKIHPFVDEEIEEIYRDYVKVCSTAAMAVSIETSRLMSTFCIQNRPETILDFGSGFSTTCFALLKRKELIRSIVTSVDDSPEWLGKTGDYLDGHGLSTDALVPLADFTYTGRYDFILHDIGNMGRRARLLPTMWNMLNEGGWLVVDDAHKPGYKKAVSEFFGSTPHVLYEPSEAQTMDQFNRFSLFIKKEEKKS